MRSGKPGVPAQDLLAVRLPWSGQPDRSPPPEFLLNLVQTLRKPPNLLINMRVNIGKCDQIVVYY
jgi:hypothetical protein